MSTLLIEGAILDREPVTVTVRDGLIESVVRGGGGTSGGGADADRTIDASGLHLFPAFRNGHTHAAMTLFRGWGDDMPLMEWLETRIWPAEAKLTPDDVYAGTRLGILEMIRSGTVFFSDMYWHTGAIARAVEEMGVKALLGATFLDLGQEAVARKWRSEVEKAVEMATDWGPRLGLAMAPHAIYSVSAKNLQWMADLGREHGLLYHVHLSETAGEVENCVEAHEMHPGAYLDSLGLVDDRLVAAHGTWLDERELALLGEAGASVVHNPVANLKLATGGILDYPGARKAGVEVVLGTDGTASNNTLDMIEEMKVAALVQKHRAHDATALPADEALDLATAAPVRVFGAGGQVGAFGLPGSGAASGGSGEDGAPASWRDLLAPGRPADLVLVDLRGPGTQPGHNAVSDLVYASHGGRVHTTICDGRVLMHDRVVEVVDEAEVVAEARAAAERVTG